VNFSSSCRSRCIGSQCILSAIGARATIASVVGRANKLLEHRQTIAFGVPVGN
jgi:hypothetical protein